MQRNWASSADKLMVYGGPFLIRYDIKDINGPSTTYVESTGFNLGVGYGIGKSSSIYMETAQSTVRSGASTHSGNYYGLTLEFSN